MRSAVLPLLVLLASSLSAQTIVTPSAVSTTDTTVFTPLSRKSVQAPRDLTAGLEIELTQPGMVVRTRIQCDHQPTTGVVYQVLDHWQVTSAFGGTHGTFGTGPHSTLLRIAGNRTVTGRLVIDARSLVRNGSSVVGRVDVGDDGTDEFVVVPGSVQQFEMPLTVSPAGAVIKTTTGTAGTTAPGSQTWSSTLSLELRFLPDLDCSAQIVADTCGPVLEAKPNFDRQLEIGLSTSAPNATGVLLVGTTPLTIGLPPPTFCGFLTQDPLLTASAPFANDGTTLFLMPIPAIAGLQFTMQGAAVFVDGNGHLRVRMSWGLWTTCR